MKFEVLPNKKKRITITLVVVGLVTIIGIATFSLTRAKYQYTKSIPLIRANNISYSKSDLEIVAIKLQQDDGNYKDSNTIPQSGYIINEKETSCKVKDTTTNVKFTNIDGVNYIAPTEKGTKCSLVFDKVNFKNMILAENGGEEVIKIKLAPNFDKSSCSSGCDENTTGMYAMEDDDGTSYYFRGSVTNNYVRFGKYSSSYSNATLAGKDMYWRIIRINGDGTIRMIYDGTSYHPNGTSTTNSIAVANQKFNKSNGNNAYVGYTYALGSKRGTGTDSNAKTQLDNWYTSSGLSSYASYLADSGFCGDRTSTTSSTGIPNNTGGTGSTKTYYGSKYRTYEKFIPTLKCSTISYGTSTSYEKGNKADVYTISSTKGNGQLQYPIGLISADEVVVAGGIPNYSNSKYYLFNGQYYWTMSPHLLDVNTWISGVTSSGYLMLHTSDDTKGLRPVINLDPTKINSVSLVDGVYVVS